MRGVDMIDSQNGKIVEKMEDGNVIWGMWQRECGTGMWNLEWDCVMRLWTKNME